MNKVVNDFKNVFSVIFFLIGAYFLIMGVNHIGIVALISLVIIVFINSDWFYANFDIKHYNTFSVVIVFALILLNSFFLYNEMKLSFLFNRVSLEDKTNYIAYENNLYTAIKPCSDVHNNLIVLMNNKKEISKEDVKSANMTCYRTIEHIERQDANNNLPKEIKNLCNDERTNFMQIAINLSSFEYSSNNPQTHVKTRINDYYKNAITDMQKIRKVMRINEPVNDEIINLVKF
ncbi:MAG: hypothetical protein MJ180_04420 [Candidatus Gastranaerophilales bacterium]|nr:hypothetical protein [Candidatus Gastranaerophilales bacterium]